MKIYKYVATFLLFAGLIFSVVAYCKLNRVGHVVVSL